MREPSGPAEARVSGTFAQQVHVLSDKEFRRIAGYVRKVPGISLPEQKRALLQTRLTRRLRALDIEDFHECALIEGENQAVARECQEPISAITTNATRFFREPHHFEDLRVRILPPLIAQATRGRPVRLWSAGWSTGEEPYPIALTLLDLAPDAGRCDIRILATDVDRAALGTALRGVYSERLTRAVPAALSERTSR